MGKKKRIDGIYLIKNSITKKVRVGSAKDIPKRFSNYKARLRNGNGNKLMQEDYNWHGEQSFDFIILEECNVKDLFIREKYYLELYSDCAMYNKNAIKNVEKKIRRGMEAKKYKEKRSKITSGENNGHYSGIPIEYIEEMKWLKDNSGLTYKQIGEIYGKSDTYVGRLGHDRWLDIETRKPDWYKENEAFTIGVVKASLQGTSNALESVQN